MNLIFRIFTGKSSSKYLAISLGGGEVAAEGKGKKEWYVEIVTLIMITEAVLIILIIIVIYISKDILKKYQTLNIL